MAMRLGDVLTRRLHLFYEAPDQGAAIARPVADRMAKLLGWDAARRDQEVADYRRAVERSRASLKEIPRASKITA